MAKRIELKSADELVKMRRAGVLLRSVFNELENHIAPGVTTLELDQIAYKAITGAGARPAFLGYHGFPGTLCTSVNEEIVHGIPGPRVLNAGDIISVDCGLFLEGYCADSAKTYAVGDIDATTQKLLDVTAASLVAGIAACVPGNRLGDLSAAIQGAIDPHGFGIVRDYGGHGIGRSMHEEPHVPNFGKAGSGVRFQSGMVLAIEPMVNVGTPQTRTLADEWTVVTRDGSMSAHFEHTVAITDDGPLILTA